MPDLFQVFFTFFRGIVSNRSEDENVCDSDNESAHIIGTTTPKEPNDDGKGEDDDGDDGLFHNVFFIWFQCIICKMRAKLG